MDDDFDTDEGLAARNAEYARVAAAGVPPRRSPRAGLAATTAAIDAVLERERAPLPTDA